MYMIIIINYLFYFKNLFYCHFELSCVGLSVEGK